MTRYVEYIETLTADHVSPRQAAERTGYRETYIRSMLRTGELVTYKLKGLWPTWLSLTELEARKERMRRNNPKEE
jgi:hypothetical protein